MAYGFTDDDGNRKVAGDPSKEERYIHEEKVDEEEWNPEEETWNEFERRVSR